jgi:UDP-N-acetylglucosamine acyltransferase
MVAVMNIHPTAMVSPATKIAGSVSIGPYAVIEDCVEIREGCEIGAHAVIKQFTILAARNRVFEHTVLGGAAGRKIQGGSAVIW